MQNREANNIEDPVRGMVAQCASMKKEVGTCHLGYGHKVEVAEKLCTIDWPTIW